jgi:hypothetical protein
VLEITVAVAICLVILGAWFVLRISVAELIFALFVFGAGAVGVYWFWMGRRVSAIVEGVAIFVLLVILLGSIRIGIEKLRDMLARLRIESGKQHYPALPR